IYFWYMNTSVLIVKTPTQIKTKAQEVAKELGFSLSSLVNAYLRELVKTKTVHFSLENEEPTPFLLQALKESNEDIKAGRVSPAFSDAEDAINWLHQQDPKYGDQV
ncbi:MAG TPA: hypothetical protein PLS49_06125, partial [Candidatus Woesebacteria bacterium]|nr:hypothetical protein [Candidatus Woesebacteria bacterium]